MADCGDLVSSCNSAEDKSQQPVNDAELDDLLEDALHDFETVKSRLHNTEVEPEPTDGTNKVLESDPATSRKQCPEMQRPKDMQAMESLLMSLMSEGPSTLESHLADLDLSGVDGASTGADTDLADTLQRTLGSLAQGTQDLQNKDFSEEELMKLMSDTFSGSGLDGVEDDEFSPMMQGMMKSLLSKDILYPSLKDISTKYPEWLESNRDQLPSDELSRYERQYHMMATIVSEFDEEQPTDAEDVKSRRFERILDAMQQMQELGQPPKELVGDAPKEFELDDDGFPKIPLPGGMPSAEQCCLM